MYSSCIHGRDLGKLNNSQKWSEPPPYTPPPAKAKGVGRRSQLWEVIKKITINIGRYVFGFSIDKFLKT